MKKILVLITGLFITGLSYCQITEPYYTSVEKLYKINPGMTFSRVNEVLGISPYDFYYNIEDSSIVYLYKYKHKMLKIIGEYDIREETYLTQGEAYFTEPGNIYMVFNSTNQEAPVLVSFFTDSGRNSSYYIMKIENTLKQIFKNHLNFLKLIDRKAKKKDRI